MARFDDLELVPGALLPGRWAQVEELVTVEDPASYAVSSQTLLERDGRFSVHWLPFERLNGGASIALVGLTPGRGQAAMAFGAAKSAMEDGATPRDLLERVGLQAAFGGPMRTVLVRRLDGIGLPAVLQVRSTSELFAEANGFVRMTSALRYTTLRDGKKPTRAGMSRSVRTHTRHRGTSTSEANARKCAVAPLKHLGILASPKA